MQRIIVLLIPAAALLFHSCGTPASGKNVSMTNDTIPVKVIALDQPFTTQGIAVSGQYTTDDETLLSFKTGGVVNSILVKEGDLVDYRQAIGKLGSSGRSSGPHVHYEVRFEGKALDPMGFLKAGRYVFKG